jgi:Flp pilus assembly protein TadB
MTAALAMAALAGLAVAAATRRLRPTTRTFAAPSARQARPVSVDYAVVLDGIARQVRSGVSLTGAVIAETSGLPAANPLVGSVTISGAATADSPADADLALTLQALSAAARLGGAVAVTLDAAAAVLRDRAAGRAERVAHSAQARLSARVLTIVPLGFAAWSAFGSQRTREVYIDTLAGSACALLGLLLNLTGWLWMKRIVAR